jgi:hypothetical protein
MERSADSPIEVEFARRFLDQMDTELITNALVSMWQEIDAVLCPIIGQRGVAALYHRTIHLTGRTYPWLVNSPENPQTFIDLTHLKALLMQQERLLVIASGGLLLKTFSELLVSLVGLSLAERLLRSVGAHLFSGASAQDSS